MRARWVADLSPSPSDNRSSGLILMTQVAGWWPTTHYGVFTSFVDTSEGIAALTRKLDPEYVDHYHTMVYAVRRDMSRKRRPAKILYLRNRAELDAATKDHAAVVAVLNSCFWCRWTLFLGRRGLGPLGQQGDT
jgi:hypothetical protein